MERLLGRSKSYRHRATREEQPLEFGFTQSPTIDPGPTYPWKTRNVMAMRAATGADQWVDISDVHTRPKTSNAASSPMRNMATVGAPFVITADDEVFQFPTPRRANFSPATPVSGVRSEPEDIGIGVALGSPSQTQHFQGPGIAIGSPSQMHHFQNFAIHPLQTSTPASNDMCSPVKSTPNEQREMRHDMNEPGKPKLSRWRSLGSFFGKRGLQQQHDDYQMRQPEVKVEEFTTSLPANNHPGAAMESPKETKKSKRKQKRGVEHLATGPIFLSEAGHGPNAPPKGPLLNVDIPDIQMERYSVMFSSVLPSRKPSLLARRQGGKASTLEPLQIPNAPGLRRRATSPNPSPSYTLFPQRDVRAPKNQPDQPSTVLSRPRPLRRTKTAPSLLSPKPEVDEPITPMTGGDELLVDEKNRQALTPTPSEPSSPSTPKDGEEGNLGGRPNNWKYSLMNASEPEWEMITVGKKAEPGDRMSESTVGHDLHREAKHDTIYNAIHNLEEDWHHYRGEVQVARSLSVTKAKRHLLRPLAIRDQAGEKVNESRALTPTLVEMKQRKSMMVRIEDA